MKTRLVKGNFVVSFAEVKRHINHKDPGFCGRTFEITKKAHPDFPAPYIACTEGHHSRHYFLAKDIVAYVGTLEAKK